MIKIRSKVLFRTTVYRVEKCSQKRVCFPLKERKQRELVLTRIITSDEHSNEFGLTQSLVVREIQCSPYCFQNDL